MFWNKIFLKTSLAAAILAAILMGIGGPGAFAAQSPQIPLPGAGIPQFAQPLPLLSAENGTIQTVIGNRAITIRMCEFKARALPPSFVPPAGSTYAGYTWVWGYLPDPTNTSTSCADLISLYGDANGILDTYLGPAILNQRGPLSTDITFINELGSAANTNVLAYKYSTDQTLHWADPLGSTPEFNACKKAGTIPAYLSTCAENYLGPIPAVPHLHGGEVPPELDGGPDAWFTSDGLKKGHGYHSFAGAPAPPNGAIYKYPNMQEAAPIWFHDHVLGVTRLNVYAGLAGAYLIYDNGLALPPGLHQYGLMNAGGTPATLQPTVPLIIQDRMFDTNGQLFYTADSAGGVLWTTNPEHPYWTPEFLGDTIVVNGKAWPYLNVEPKRYRFWLINGSNARTYEMFLIDPAGVAIPPRMWVISTDGGYLDTPVLAKKLVMMPGERYEVIIDFAGIAAGTRLVLKNTAKSPYPAGVPVNGATTGQIMQFRIGACTSGYCGATDASFNPAVAGAFIRPFGKKIVRLPGAPGGPAISTTNVQKVRQLTLNEVMGAPRQVVDPVTGVLTAYPGGPLEVLVNNTKYSGESPRTYGDFIGVQTNIPGTTVNDETFYTERPAEGDTEVWEIVNLTADAHPIHLHLVQFQIVDRRNFSTNKYNVAYNAAFPVVPGNPVCTGGVFCPGFGPPLHYDSGNPRALGGNPDITPYLQGKAAPPLAEEAGWKDTVVAYPGQVTRLAVRWAPTDLPNTTPPASAAFAFSPDGHGYVWHCHIIDHEDNEMMRPTQVQPLPGVARTYQKGINY